MEASIETDTKENTQYFSVAIPKFILMSVCTMGLYELYWFYKNWGHIKNKNNLEIMPFWRAFFAPLWAYSSFNHIRDELGEQEISLHLYAGFLAILYFILQSLWRLPDPYWLISFLSVFLMLPANAATTKINERVLDNFQQNSKIQGWNWLAVLLGVPFFLLALIGTFMPTPA